MERRKGALMDIKEIARAQLRSITWSDEASNADRYYRGFNDGYDFAMSSITDNGAPKLDQGTQLGMILDLYFALEQRDQCPNCGGKGHEYVDDGNGDVELESCACSNEAYELLEHHRANFMLAVDEYLRLADHDSTQIADSTQDLLTQFLDNREDRPKGYLGTVEWKGWKVDLVQNDEDD